MKLDSPWFDRIRSAPKAERVDARPKTRTCEHPGCALPGEFRAPKGRNLEGQYYNFCFDHVRQYNQSYNYFVDMPDDAVAAWQKDSLTGHRPTWTMGVNSWGRNGARDRAEQHPPRWGAFEHRDPFDIFEEEAATKQQEKRRTRPLRNVERKSFEELGLDETANADEIKARFKTLVKRLHPDANGGDRGTEDKLRAVIQAYNYLKQAGLC